jgi:AraC-like DNA-binding protein
MRYREFPAPAGLVPLVECIWTLTPAASSTAAVRVYPDGATDCLIAGGRVTVHGPASSFRWISPQVPLAGLRLRRGAARTVLGISPAELAAGPVSLAALWGRRGHELEARLLTAWASADPVTALGAVFRERLAGAGAPDLAVLTTIDRAGRAGFGAVGRMARDAGVSERQLRRRFVSQVGMGIKQYARVMRFQQLLDAVRELKRRGSADSPAWAGLAYEYGFADQSHLIREVREFAGLTPAELLGTI